MATKQHTKKIRKKTPKNCAIHSDTKLVRRTRKLKGNGTHYDSSKLSFGRGGSNGESDVPVTVIIVFDECPTCRLIYNLRG